MSSGIAIDRRGFQPFQSRHRARGHRRQQSFNDVDHRVRDANIEGCAGVNGQRRGRRAITLATAAPADDPVRPRRAGPRARVPGPLPRSEGCARKIRVHRPGRGSEQRCPPSASSARATSLRSSLKLGAELSAASAISCASANRAAAAAGRAGGPGATARRRVQTPAQLPPDEGEAGIALHTLAADEERFLVEIERAAIRPARASLRQPKPTNARSPRYCTLPRSADTSGVETRSRTRPAGFAGRPSPPERIRPAIACRQGSRAMT